MNFNLSLQIWMNWDMNWKLQKSGNGSETETPHQWEISHFWCLLSPHFDSFSYTFCFWKCWSFVTSTVKISVFQTGIVIIMHHTDSTSLWIKQNMSYTRKINNKSKIILGPIYHVCPCYKIIFLLFLYMGLNLPNHSDIICLKTKLKHTFITHILPKNTFHSIGNTRCNFNRVKLYDNLGH